VVILVVSSLPGVEVDYLSFDWGDKLAHLGEYAILGALLTRMFWPSTKGVLGAAVISLPIGIGFAAADELHQIPIRNRYCEWGDFIFDGAGVILGLAIYGLLRRVKN
jgi:VanZ family protein